MYPPPHKPKKNKFIKNTICSLYEVENFLKGYNTFTDAVCIFKILQRHKHNKKNFPAN